jgi:hypothetical protein
MVREEVVLHIHSRSIKEEMRSKRQPLSMISGLEMERYDTTNRVCLRAL